jgi:hypothetical protein
MRKFCALTKEFPARTSYIGMSTTNEKNISTKFYTITLSFHEIKCFYKGFIFNQSKMLQIHFCIFIYRYPGHSFREVQKSGKVALATMM